MNNFTISSISTIKLIDKEVWNSFIENETPFLSYEFLLALEESGCTSKQNGWEPNHIIIQENKNLKCLIPNYKKNNSNGEYGISLFDFDIDKQPPVYRATSVPHRGLLLRNKYI